MIQKKQFFLYTLLFSMVFFTFAVYAEVPTAAQAERSAEATFYVH